jgi:hypothetical protein
VAKPLRLMAVYLHEASHAVACWLTCGTVHKIQVFDNEGGVTEYAGGCRCVIIPAGYVGCSFFAMLFVVLSGGRKTATAAACVFVMSLLLALCYSPNRAMVCLNLGWAIAVSAFVAVEWCWYTPILQFVILFMGVFVGIVAVHDIWNDTIVRSVYRSDSYACYTEVCPCCLPRCVGLQWIVLAIFFQIFGAWLAIVQMSNECENRGWLQCLKLTFDIDFDYTQHHYYNFDGFWHNGP